MALCLMAGSQGTAEVSAANGRLTLVAIKLSDIFALIAFNALFFESFFQNNVSSAFSAIDEICVVGLLFVVIKEKLGSRDAVVSVRTGGIVLATCLFLLVGIVGTLIAQIQLDVYPVIIDFFTSGKGLLCLAAALYLAQAETGTRDVLARIIVAECKILTVILLSAAFVNLAVDVGFGGEGGTRYGLRPFAFIFYHPTIVVYLVTGLAAILIASEGDSYKWMLCLGAVLALTLRSKGFGEAAIICFIAFVLWAQGRKAKLRWWHVLIAVFALLAVGWSQLDYYYFSNESSEQARTILTRTSFELANEYLPIGAGFGTYGSAVTAGAEYYSPLYLKYGFNSIWGLSLMQSGYITDSFWPTVVGQFGYLGLALMAIAIVLVCRSGYRYAKILGPRAVGAFLVVIAYLFLSSSSESAFFAPQCVYLALCLCIALLVATACRDVRR